MIKGEKQLKSYASVGRLPVASDLLPEVQDKTKEQGTPKPKTYLRDINEYGPQSPQVLDVKKQIKKNKISLKVTEIGTQEANDIDQEENHLLSQAEKIDMQNRALNL
jgi:hypothetical protein